MTISTRQVQAPLKFWPQLAMASWRINASGAYRVWRLAHYQDLPGSGKVEHGELIQFLLGCGIRNRKTQWNWINQAVEIGLFLKYQSRKDNKTYYRLACQARAAAALECTRVGNPAEISLHDFIRPGWRSYIWGAFNATLSGPMSQQVKQELTRVPERSQRRYLEQLPVKKHRNYTRRNLPADSNYLLGYEEVTGRTVFINEQGEVIQKLPDHIVVPGQVAMKSPRGRSRKAQQKLNSFLSRVGQDKSIKEPVRLWHATPRALRATVRKTAQLPIVDLPDDLFLKGCTMAGATFWEAEPMLTI